MVLHDTLDGADSHMMAERVCAVGAERLVGKELVVHNKEHGRMSLCSSSMGSNVTFSRYYSNNTVGKRKNVKY